MWASIAQFVGSKVLTAVLVVSGAAAVIWFWRHPESLRAIWATIRGALAWLGLVIALPWATFFIPARVVKSESNAAAAVMLIGYLMVDVLAALWLAGWHIEGTLTWAVVILGFLAAAIYNFLVCDFVADRVDEMP